MKSTFWSILEKVSRSPHVMIKKKNHIIGTLEKQLSPPRNSSLFQRSFINQKAKFSLVLLMNKFCTTFQKHNCYNLEGLPKCVFCLSLVILTYIKPTMDGFIEIHNKWHMKAHCVCFLLLMFLSWYNGDNVYYFIHCSVMQVLKSKVTIGTSTAAVWGLSFLCYIFDMIQLYFVYFFLACHQPASSSYTPSSDPRECVSLTRLISISWTLPFIAGHIVGHLSSYSSVTVDSLCRHGPKSMSSSMHWFLQ